MPIVKPISGHTDCQGIRRYLEKDGRALARDFYNLSWDEDLMAGYDSSMKEGVRWADEMDRTRHAYGNDMPHGGRPARTFKHFVISPDPEDGLDLMRLRELACAWAKECFGDYQVAIIYHDDNEARIPHAHIVVNNTNLVTGNRLHTDSPMSLNRLIQQMAKRRGLRYLADEPDLDDGFSKLAAKDEEPTTKARTRQDVYMGRAERRVLESGEYSWVNDIRDRVATAKGLARNEAEFREILNRLDVDVNDSAAHGKREDWIYSLRDQGARRVSGERLGYLFGKEALQARFAAKNPARPDPSASKAIMACAVKAAVINDLAELHQLADVIELNNRYGIKCQDDYMRRISTLLEKQHEAKTPRASIRCLDSIERLEAARAFVVEKDLLPKARPKPARKMTTSIQKKAAAERRVNRNSKGGGKPRAQQRNDQTRKGVQR